MHFGPRDLIFSKHIYDEILNRIKSKNPDISKRKLNKIRQGLWLLMDGINSHNGETSEFEYNANSRKTENMFLEEMLLCHVQKGYDKKIVPATPEAALMRLCDKISYIPYDMVDGLREGFIDQLNGEYIELLKKFGIDDDTISKCQQNKNYEPIAEKLQEMLIEDVIDTSKVQKTKSKISRPLTIRLSKEKADLLHKLRNLNNKYIVDNVVLNEDYDTYNSGIKALTEDLKGFLTSHNLTGKLSIGLNPDEQAALKKEFSNTKYEAFMDFITAFSPEEYRFIKKMLSAAKLQSAIDELTLAEDIVLNGKAAEGVIDKEKFPKKYARIEQFISIYRENNLHSSERNVPYSQEDKQTLATNILCSPKYASLYLSKDESIAYEIATKFLSIQDDANFMNMLLQFEIINQEQYKNLRIPYSKLPRPLDVYKDNNWKSQKAGFGEK